jgi:3alpha(or 20beta)-hydroxysteroid dehydrogenase
MFRLDGKCAIVTGAASGIGAATAERLAAAGARVSTLDLTPTEALSAKTGGVGITVDVSDETAMSDAILRASAAMGGLDIMVNNAGIGDGEALLEGQGTALYERMFRVNTLGVVIGTRHAAAIMARQGRGGAIVNTASLAGTFGFPTYGAYTASKGAVVSFTRVAATELGPFGIRVNCICPSTVDTPMMDDPSAAAEGAMMAMATPLGRICKPGEVAALIHFLVADDCAFVSGQAVLIDGAVTAGFAPALVETLVAAAVQRAI